MNSSNFAPTSCRIWKTQLVQDDNQNQIVPTTAFLIIYGAHMNNLSIIKVKILLFINDHLDPPNYVDHQI
jgi:hypothetical protein